MSAHVLLNLFNELRKRDKMLFFCRVPALAGHVFVLFLKISKKM